MGKEKTEAQIVKKSGHKTREGVMNAIQDKQKIKGRRNGT